MEQRQSNSEPITGESNARPTKAQRAALRYLLDHPGSTVFDFYDARRGGSFGLERVSVRGAAGRMFYRLEAAGWVEGSNRGEARVTAAGEEAAGVA